MPENSRFSQQSESQFPEGEGPRLPRDFLFGGILYRVPQRILFRLLAYLWERPSHTAFYLELAEPVWNDHAMEPSDEAVKSQRRNANDFFRVNQIPYKVATEMSLNGQRIVYIEPFQWPAVENAPTTRRSKRSCKPQ